MSSDGSSKLTAPAVPSSSEFAHSGLRGVDPPDDLRRHPLVAGRHFNTLPLELWKGFHGAVRITQLDQETAAVDRALSEFAESLDGCVGFAEGVPIVDWLVRPPAPLDGQLPAVQGYLEECRRANIRVDDVVPIAKRRFTLQRIAQQGYLGWLLTNPDFLNELREFWQTFSDLGQDGRAVPVGTALQAQAGRSSPNAMRDPESDPVAHLVDAFCRRWRLSQVVAPLTLRPLGVQFPAPLPLLSAAHAQTSGALLFIPDIAPLPDRDELRLMMEEVARQTTRSSPHLGEWFELVLADNQGRKTLHNYARCLPLQHYLRVLHGRYGDQLQRSHQRVKQAVASFLGLTEHQMRSSVRSIRSRLGANWLDPADCQFWSM